MKEFFAISAAANVPIALIARSARSWVVRARPIWSVSRARKGRVHGTFVRQTLTLRFPPAAAS